MSRIALYVPSLRGGGAEKVTVLLANGLAARGYSVDLVVVSSEGPYLKAISPCVRLIDLKSSRVSTSLPGLVWYLRNERPSVLISAMTHANVVAILAKKLSGLSIKVFVSEHTSFSASRRNPTNLRGRVLGVRIRRWAYLKADALIAVSKGVAEDLANGLGIPKELIKVIHNPVVTPELQDLSKGETLHPWYGIDSVPIILSVGRFTKAKDFSTLIRAFFHLRKLRDAKLIILGEGELRQELESLISELGLEHDVSLPGFVNNPYPYMRKSDLFVLSSAWEGLPTVLIEAMACGIPIVSTDCPSGPSEILENGKWGKLVPVGNVSTLAKAMEDGLDRLDHPKVIKRAMHFRVDCAVDEYASLLDLS